MKAKYRIIKADGRYLNAGTDLPSWFTLEKARELRDQNPGSQIVEHDGVRVLWEVL